jgi:type VI secretion system FHA domain protein
MPLTLEVTGPQAAALGAASRKVFDAAGGTIGRLADNTWALPDPYVSSRHAVIRYRDGTYYIEDTSTNGVFVNSPDNQLVKGQPYALKSGDWILIEPYEIRASITSDAPKPSPSFDPMRSAPPPHAPHSASLIPDDPFREPFAPAHGAGRSILPGADLIPEPAAGGEEVDPLNLLGLEPKWQPPKAPKAADLARGSVLSEHYQAPHVPAPPPPSPPSPAADLGGMIPDDYNPLETRGGFPTSPPRPAAPAPPAPKPPLEVPRPAVRTPAPAVPVSHAPKHEPRRPATPPEGDLATVLAGAGLENVPVTQELARSFGHILRVVVGGVMDILQARQKIKSEFRIGMTTFKPVDNNPLKFSANVDDALHNLLVKRNAAYLGPVDAFEDAFDDVRNHQMAMLAGVRVAFEAMLAEFDPDRLQEAFDHQIKKGGLLQVPAKMKYWDLYRDRIHDMVRDPEATFRELFGDEFAKAYEEQLRRLKAQGRAEQG